MVVHILCPECSEDIGEIYLAFELYKTEMYKQHLGDKYDSGKINFKPNVLPGLDTILHELGIDKICCRIHIMGESGA